MGISMAIINSVFVVGYWDVSTNELAHQKESSASTVCCCNGLSALLRAAQFIPSVSQLVQYCLHHTDTHGRFMYLDIC